MITPVRRFGAAIGLCLLFVAAPARADGQWVEGILAVVGGEPLLASQLRARAQFAVEQLEQGVDDEQEVTQAQLARVYQTHLDDMIDRKLLTLEAKRLEISVTRAEVDRAIAHIAAQNGMTVEAFLEEALRAMRRDEEAYRADIAFAVLEGKLVFRVAKNMPSDEAAQAAHMQQTRQELLRALWKRYGVDVRVRFE